jgi:hypothetical protein
VGPFRTPDFISLGSGTQVQILPGPFGHAKSRDHELERDTGLHETFLSRIVHNASRSPHGVSEMTDDIRSFVCSHCGYTLSADSKAIPDGAAYCTCGREMTECGVWAAGPLQKTQQLANGFGQEVWVAANEAGAWVLFFNEPALNMFAIQGWWQLNVYEAPVYLKNWEFKAPDWRTSLLHATPEGITDGQ